MPYLNLKGDERDGLRVQAMMVYPNDMFKNSKYMAAESLTKAVLNTPPGDNFKVSRESLFLALESKGFIRETEGWMRAMRGGCTAGDVLHFLIQMKLSGVKEPSVRKAVYLTSKYNDFSANEYGERVTTSTRGVWGHLKEYSSVMHLWAAFRAFQDKYEERRSEYGFDSDIFKEKLPSFLSLSESFLEFGTKYKADRAKTNVPLISNDDAWHVPPDFSYQPFELCLKDLPDDKENWVAKELENYSVCCS